MLVLSRKENESILINDQVIVTVLALNGKRVRIGIEAPRGVPVFRTEVYERIKGTKISSSVHKKTEGRPR